MPRNFSFIAILLMSVRLWNHLLQYTTFWKLIRKLVLERFITYARSDEQISNNFVLWMTTLSNVSHLKSIPTIITWHLYSLTVVSVYYFNFLLCSSFLFTRAHVGIGCWKIEILSTIKCLSSVRGLSNELYDFQLLLFFINHFIYISDRRRVKVNRNLVNLHEGFGSK